ncbi:MAG: hypothetical protein ACI8TX_001403 [Hyphomicrobiaceae bacterium]|jgi:uncharacterized protein YbjQ (UPF0145 family)
MGVDAFLEGFQSSAFFILLLLGYVAGRAAEKRHYASIHKRENALRLVPVLTLKTLPDPTPILASELVSGSVVIAIDFYKRFLMGLRGLVGGEAKSYSSLIDRARREAMLRMRDSANDADAFLNLRIQTATLYGGRGNNASSVEVIAYATAVRFKEV